MSYRKRENGGSRKLRTMRAARLRQIQDGPSPDYPLPLPELRRVITVTDLDFGECTHRIELYRSGRIDTYDMIVDGRPYRNNVGWSTVLEIIRKQFLRVRAV